MLSRMRRIIQAQIFSTKNETYMYMRICANVNSSFWKHLYSFLGFQDLE